MKHYLKAPLVCSACGSIIILTGVATRCISHDVFSLCLIILGAAIIAAGVIWLFISRKLAANPKTSKNDEKLINNYVDFFARLAEKEELGRIYMRKLKKFRRRLHEIIKTNKDAQPRAFAAYLYYVNNMDKRLKCYGYEKVTNCIYGLLKQDETEAIIDNIPEGMTFCDFVEKTLKNQF